MSKASIRGTLGFPGVSGSPSTWAGGPVRGKDWLPWSSRWTSAQSLPPFRTISSQLKGRPALGRLLAGAGVPSALSSQQTGLPGLAPGAAEAEHTSQAGATGQSWCPDQAPHPGRPSGAGPATVQGGCWLLRRGCFVVIFLIHVERTKSPGQRDNFGNFKSHNSLSTRNFLAEELDEHLSEQPVTLHSGGI